jgi:predicted DNA-binding transcriptional regulator AlpA
MGAAVMGKLESEFLDDLIQRVAEATAKRLVDLLPKPAPPPTKSSAPSQYLTTREAAKLAGLSASTLEAWRARGKGPKAVKLETAAVRYKREDLERWLANEKGAAK